MDWHAPRRQWQRDPAGADPELERASAPRELGKEVDDGIDNGRGEHLVGALVVRSRQRARRSCRRRAQPKSIARSLDSALGHDAERADLENIVRAVQPPPESRRGHPPPCRRRCPTDRRPPPCRRSATRRSRPARRHASAPPIRPKRGRAPPPSVETRTGESKARGAAHVQVRGGRDDVEPFGAGGHAPDR